MAKQNRARTAGQKRAAIDQLIEDGKLPQTRALQEEWVRRVPMLCLGPFLPGIDPAEARARVNAMRAAGKRVEAAAYALSVRRACGFDMTEVYASGPFDGELHECECPRCGLKGEYRAAHFNEGQGTAPARSKGRKAKRSR